MRDADGETALTRAASEGHPGAVQLLVEAGVDPDQLGANGDTALMRAMGSDSKGSDAVFAFLVLNGANVHARNEAGEGVFDFAATGGSQVKIEAFAVGGGSWTPMSIRTALADAAGAGNMRVVSAMADLTKDDGVRRPALCYAIERGHLEIIKELLGRGVSPQGNCGSGKTPLSNAIRHGTVSLVEKLLDAGADPGDSFEGADPPLIFAASLDRTDVVELLITRGVDVDQRGTREMTALMVAALRGHLEPVRRLLDAGADRRKRSDTDQTALALARQAQAEDVVNLIESHRIGWKAWLSSKR